VRKIRLSLVLFEVGGKRTTIDGSSSIGRLMCDPFGGCVSFLLAVYCCDTLRANRETNFHYYQYNSSVPKRS